MSKNKNVERQKCRKVKMLRNKNVERQKCRKILRVRMRVGDDEGEGG